jgi:DNA-binding CsgD family transcriptional regulator
MEQFSLLSRREKEVITLLLQGKGNKQIALSLGISERTVEFHLKNICAKYQVNTRIELILEIGKATGSIPENLWKSTVDIADNNSHNGKQSVAKGKWAQPLKHSIFMIKKEFAMTKTILFESVGNFLRKHPLLLTSLLFLILSATVRYLVIDFGLYLWLSYVLLGLFLGAGSLYFGLSWGKIANGKIYFRPYVIVILALLPICLALMDMIIRNIIAQTTGQAAIIIAGISNKVMWIVPPDGNAYFYTERMIPTDNLWLYATLYMLLLFLVGIMSNKWFAQMATGLPRQER